MGAKNTLDDSIQFVKGVGPKLAERFASRGIETVSDALFFLPRRYEDRRPVNRIADLQVGELASFQAEIIKIVFRRAGPRRRIFEIMLGDDSGRILARWFNFHAASFAKKFEEGQSVQVVGKVEIYKAQRQIVHPEIDMLVRSEKQGQEEPLRLLPVYPEIDGIYAKSLRRIMQRVVEKYVASAQELLPEQVRKAHSLMPVAQALLQVHRPQPGQDVEELNAMRSPAQRRLIFEEFFVLQTALALRRQLSKNTQATSCPAALSLREEARSLFGFDLTSAQERVLGEIAEDLASDKPMNRLLHGDVGSGKTAIGVLAAISVIRSGAQAAFMAPTEVLAEQHYRRLQARLAKSQPPVRCVYLSSAVKGVERRRVLEEISSGKAQLVVGTQALLEEKVKFSRLALCIIDEQHRFGVLQRARLRAKGPVPHVLVMTATPIPRTLSMTLYGDLDLSILDEMPPGRSEIKTTILRGSKAGQAYQHVRFEVEAGGQAYLIYPLVEESDKVALLDASNMHQRLKKGVFSELTVGLLHGRLAADEKEQVMADFAAGRIQVLVSTTVVEVGVDVTAASIIVIEHAERFGLSQLHQLRGRVGRGGRPGICYLVAHTPGSEDARARLRVMERSQDGFEIAEEDLAIRGPGEFLGTRQSGMPVFHFAHLLRDEELLTKARQAAFEWIEQDPGLRMKESLGLARAIRSRWGERLQLAEVG
ncbi:MAG: ATP-dependent DNA helicase RecG [Deltaproteobacteria bacterium]|nr:ATP-dependent DNA helicase RecG [Deltaproteobacteria bacterium]